MRKALVLLMLAVFAVSFAAGASSFYGVNGSEPEFLEDVGPKDERADSVLAALVVALAVAAVILRGLRRHRNPQTDLSP